MNYLILCSGKKFSFWVIWHVRIYLSLWNNIVLLRVRISAFSGTINANETYSLDGILILPSSKFTRPSEFHQFNKLIFFIKISKLFEVRFYAMEIFLLKSSFKKNRKACSICVFETWNNAEIIIFMFSFFRHPKWLPFFYIFSGNIWRQIFRNRNISIL